MSNYDYQFTMMMSRTQVDGLRQYAKARGLSSAALIRQLIAEKTLAPAKP